MSAAAVVVSVAQGGRCDGCYGQARAVVLLRERFESQLCLVHLGLVRRVFVRLGLTISYEGAAVAFAYPV